MRLFQENFLMDFYLLFAVLDVNENCLLSENFPFPSFLAQQIYKLLMFLRLYEIFTRKTQQNGEKEIDSSASVTAERCRFMFMHFLQTLKRRK